MCSYFRRVATAPLQRRSQLVVWPQPKTERASISLPPKRSSELPMTRRTQLGSGVSDDAPNFYIPVWTRSFALRHMTVTSNDRSPTMYIEAVDLWFPIVLAVAVIRSSSTTVIRSSSVLLGVCRSCSSEQLFVRGGGRRRATEVPFKGWSSSVRL